MELDSGEVLQAHKDKENLIWEAYKDRMGKSEFTRITVDLQDFIQPSPELV
jgi:hypothetical protein